jgi:hypothetical protein
MPSNFWVDEGVIGPVEGAAIMGVEEHKSFGAWAVSVEDEIGGITLNIDQPIQIL